MTNKEAKKLAKEIKQIAKNHGFEFKHYPEDCEMAIFGTNVPTLADVRFATENIDGIYVKNDEFWGMIRIEY